MSIKRYHLDRNSIRDEHIPASEIPWQDIKNLILATVTIDPPSIAAGASANVTATVNGLTTSHKVIAQCQSDLEAGLVPQAAYCSAANTLTIRLYNPTAAAIDGAARPWFIIAWY
jgi:hypothetical protein